MIVLFISHDGAANGGAGLALIELIDDLNINNEITPVVLTPKKDLGLIEQLKKRNIEYIEFDNYWWCFVDRDSLLKNIYNYFKLIFWQVNTIFKIKSLIKEINNRNIDIIHSNSSVINIGALINMFTKIPHIWHVREFGEEHHRLKFILGTKYSRKFMAKYSDKIIVISNILKDKYLKYVNKEKIELVYDGLDNKYNNKTKVEKRNTEGLKLLITGAIQKGKGQKEAIQAIGNLIKAGLDIKLLVAGRVDDSNYLEEINKVISHLSIDSSIIFLGQSKDMNKIRQAVDVELVCSYMEAFGRVTVEAMLSKLPVIASNSGANEELIIDKFNGLIYKINDINDLEQKIKFLYENRDQVKKMGQNGYGIAQEKFLINIHSKNILSLYNEIFYARRK